MHSTRFQGDGKLRFPEAGVNYTGKFEEGRPVEVRV